MTWETLLERRDCTVKRHGRFLVAELRKPSLVVSTSVQNGGQTDCVRYLLNHQSCEASGHDEVHRLIRELGYEGYHGRTCEQASLPPQHTAMMGTAANMQYAVVENAVDDGIGVLAAVTAGVESNATCAGDPARWRETASGFEKAVPYAGTINVMVVIDAALPPAALARAIAIATEGKSAALQRLAVPSRQSQDLATGTGTDQYCVAAATAHERVLTSASSHSKLGELIGWVVRAATQEALRWQNGLEASYTRSLFHALGRYGVVEATVIHDLGAHLDAHSLQLLERNLKAVAYDPLVGAAAHAMAAVLDRLRHGMLPANVERDAAVQMAATLAANVAARPEAWPDFRQRLHNGSATDARSLVLAALALGWSAKWQTS